MTTTATITEPLIIDVQDRHAIDAGCYFDEAAGQRPIDFIEQFIRLPDLKNPTKSVPMRLMQWQRHIIMRLFGWKRADGSRRYRTAWIEVAKKNSKSTLTAALVIYLLIADGEADAEIYSAATTREQAAIIFRAAEKMVSRSPALKKIIDTKSHVKRLVFPRGRAFYTVLANKPAAVDGLNAHAVIYDEMHRQASRELYDALVYAGAARTQPIQIIITTAGDSRESIGWELHERAAKIISGAIIDIEAFAYIAAAADDADPGDPAAWRAANPSLGVIVREDEIAAEYERAKSSPARMMNFRRLRLNQWTQKVSRWIDIDRWMKCPARPDPATLMGLECYGGLDLSSASDITAFTLQFPRIGIDGRMGHDVLAWFWLPEANIEHAEKLAGVPYRAWAEKGLIELTPGDYIDYSFIRKRIVELRSQFQIKEIAYDPAYAQQLAIDLASDGLQVYEFWQRPTMISPVLRYLESTVIEGRLHHGDHPILNWMASNVEVQENADGFIKAVKPKTALKIDGIVALAMSMGTHCKQKKVEETYTESPLIFF